MLLRSICICMEEKGNSGISSVGSHEKLLAEVPDGFSQLSYREISIIVTIRNVALKTRAIIIQTLGLACSFGSWMKLSIAKTRRSIGWKTWLKHSWFEHCVDVLQHKGSVDL